MDQGLISIVVPVYKVEKYLDRCINSVVNQTYKNLEIILIDDGSPDACPVMCDDWAKKDDRIKVIHKVNQGLGMARNTGIEYATGQYICFFDSDDYVALDTIEKAYISAQKYDSEIVMFGMFSVDVSGNVVKADIPKTDKIFYSDNDILDFILPNMLASDLTGGKKIGLHMSACGCMFSLKMINNQNWKFVSERDFISEDFYSLFILYKNVKRISVIHEAFYYYCFNDSSLTHVYDSNRYKRICICHAGMMKVADDYNYSITIKRCLTSQYLGSVIGSMKLIIISDGDNKSKKREIQNIINDTYLQDVLRMIKTKNESFGRKIIIQAIKRKSVIITYILLKVKCMKDNKK